MSTQTDKIKAGTEILFTPNGAQPMRGYVIGETPLGRVTIAREAGRWNSKDEDWIIDHVWPSDIKPAALSELEAQPSPDGLMNEEHWQRVRAAQVTQPSQTDKIREALELAENMASVFDQLSQKMGDLRERQFDRSRLDEIRSALAALSELEAQPSAPTVDQIMEAIRPHIEMRGGPIAYSDRCYDLRARLTKLLTNP